MTKTKLLWTACFVLLLAASAVASLTERPVNWKGLPEPFATPSVRNSPRVIDRPEGAQLQVPAGFQVEEYMSGGFERPRFMMHGPNQEILLTDSGSRQDRNGVVYVIKDKTKKAIIEGLDRPYGMEYHDGWLYVAEATSVKRYRYDAAAMSVSGEGQEIVPLHDYGDGHWTRSLLFSRDHSKLFVSVGSRSNVDHGEPPTRAALNRFNPDGTGHEIYASGMRNTIGLRLRPGTDEVWAAVQERDALGDDLVSDYVVNVEQGAFYGWPYAYTGPHPDPRRTEDVAPEMVKKTHYPTVLLGAHVAVLDILFYTGNQFPEQYQGGMFVALHGSWNRSHRHGYNISFVPFKDDKAAGGPQPFLTGWMLDPLNTDVWGRPVGLLQLPDGSLLVTDDGGQKIWRISYQG